ncbi:Uncharacterized protein (Fragment) [Durusdinium trenchii]|uniref:Uncharacterized protein n=1 Tax=Durusdinium trenchii TaxID=1381693 RepID=A0ABP0JM02_9DINO
MDSRASFKDRARQIGLPEAAIASLEGQNLATFGQFAFVSSFQPGSPDETPFVTALTKVLGEPPSPGDLAGWRRLFFESHTLTMSDLRSRLDRRDDEPPRKLLMPERAERLEAAKTTLVGLTIDSQLEPAHKLVDVVVQQAEESTIRYIPLKDCLSRESELLHNKHEQAIEFKNDGTMRLSKRQKEIRADIGGDLKAKLAMQRRALAYHLAGLCTFQKLDSIIQRMFALLTKEPVKGFRAVSLQQVILADQEMWMAAAQASRGTHLTVPGRPLDDILSRCFEAPETRYHLLPLPLVDRSLQDDAPDPKRLKWDKKGKGKGRQRGKPSFDLPDSCHPETQAGQRICAAKLLQLDLTRQAHCDILPPLVAEYKLITDACPAASCEYRLLRTLPVLKKGVIDGGFDDARGTQVDLSENFDPSQDVYGVFRTPAEFVKAALLAKHPIDAIPQIPDVLVRNVVRVLNDGPALTNAKRKLAVKKVQRLALSLQAGEVELHQSLNPEMQVVLKDKKLLLWKELMTLTDFHDKTLFDEVTKGFSLVGQAAFSEQFPHGFVPMQQTPQELRAKSIWLRKTAAAKCTASLKPDLDVQVWNQTLEECHKGWMRGPFTETRVTAMVGDPYWLATRRFALEQSDKIRLIDDGLASGLNSAFGTSNKLQLLDIDSLVSLLLCIQKLRLKASSGLCLSDGSTIQCHPSPAWEGNLELLGKTLDLKSAYKQLGPNMEDLWTRIIVVYDPHSQEPAYFVSSVLMFGSAASVYAFNRVSKSVWHITTSLLNLWQTVYYDDFPCIEPRATADCAHECVTQILDLLGWQYAKEGVKAQRFASCFNVLGVCVDLTQFDSGHILLRNKEAQVASLVGLVDQLLTDEKVPPGVAASLQGQLNFAQGQYMGSVLKPAMQFLGKIAAHGWHVSYKQELAVVHEVVVPENLLRHWKSLGNKEQLIAELELFPIVVAFQQLQPLLQRLWGANECLCWVSRDSGSEHELDISNERGDRFRSSSMSVDESDDEGSSACTLQ